MAKLFLTTLVRIDGNSVSPAATASYFNPKNVVTARLTTYTNAAGQANTPGTEIKYKGYDDTFIQTFIASEAPSTITTRMNAANTTDVYNIPLTIIPSTGSSYVVDVNVDDLWWVHVNDVYTSDSLVFIQNPTRSVIENLRVDETPSAIATLANA